MNERKEFLKKITKTSLAITFSLAISHFLSPPPSSDCDAVQFIPDRIHPDIIFCINNKSESTITTRSGKLFKIEGIPMLYNTIYGYHLIVYRPYNQSEFLVMVPISDFYDGKAYTEAVIRFVAGYNKPPEKEK